MAQATTTRFGLFRVLLGDDGDPIVYTAPCGFTSKALTLTKNLTETLIPDCDDPDAPIWTSRDAESLTASISGDGVAASQSIETWLDAYESTESVPVKIELEFPAKTITWTGRMHITSLNPSAERGGRVTMSVEAQSDGALVRTVT